MRFVHGTRDFEIDDGWWREAGMESWVRAAASYRPDCSEFRGKTVQCIEIADVEPLKRELSHGIFNDSEESGTAHDRVVRILRGFVQNAELPPVEVVALQASESHKYRLRHGAHRFYCAVAAGFVEVPSVIFTQQEVTY